MSDIAPISSKDFLNLQGFLDIEWRFTPKCVHDANKNMPSRCTAQLNCWVFVQEVSGCWFKSRCISEMFFFWDDTQKKLRDRLQIALLTLSELINLRTITSIPPEIIKKPTGVLMISGGWWKLINLLNNIRTEIWRRSLKTKREGKDKIASDHIYKIYINVFELFNRTDLDK